MNFRVISFLVFSFFILFGGLSLLSINRASNNLNYPYDKDELHKSIIAQRDFAIQKAVESGDYECCTEPPCTMCYMEANEWNNFTPGTCSCGKLIAEGKESCPQCGRESCGDSEEKESDSCTLN